MRIVHCDIENFGILSDKHYDFENGLTSFCRENGEGKTTLAAFLKAMLYGLPTDGKRLGFNDRRHYAPFNSGKFGGSLKIEKDGRIYTVTRTFDRKSETKDEVKLYIGADEQPLPENIGVFFFGMNKESFERTVFIGAEDIEISTTSDISAKLSGYVDNSAVSYDKALKTLTDARKSIKGRQGSQKPILSQLERKMDAMKTEINAEAENYAGLDGDYTKRNDLAQEIKKNEKELSRLNEIRFVLGNWEHYDTILKNAVEAENKLSEIGKAYPKGLPEVQEISHLDKSAQKMSELNTTLKMSVFKNADELERLENIFKSGIPTEEEITRAESALEEMRSVTAKIQAAEEKSPTPHQQELISRFAGKEPSDALIEKADGYVTEAARKRRELDELSEMSETQSHSPIPLVLGIIFVIAGLALALLWNIAVGIAIMVIGSAILVVALLKSGRKADNSAQKAALKAGIGECEDSLNEILVPYGYFSKNGVTAALAEFKNDFEEYKDLILQRENSEKKIGDMKKRYAECKNVHDSFFRPFSAEFEDIHALKQSIKTLGNLRDEKKDREEECKKLRTELTVQRASFDDIIKKYGLNANDDDFINKLERDRQNFDTFSGTAKKAREQAEEYKADKHLEVRPTEPADESMVQALGASISDDRTVLAKLDETIKQKEESIRSVDEKNAEFLQLKDEYAEYAEKHRLVSAAESFLMQAEQQLRDKYVGPVENDCRKYASQVESTLGEKVVMDKEYHIYFEKDGLNREISHLSTGQRTLAALCFRLALTDNMFPQNRPFLILDDPFTGLDDKHLKKAAELVKTLADDRQIIYFCAHESRMI